MPHLAFIGPIGSGKTTTAKAYGESSTENVVRLGFAYPLKDEVASAFSGGAAGLQRQFREEMDDPDKKKFWRTVLQWWGEGKRQRFGDDYWIRKFKVYFSVEEARGNTVVVDDLRYQNEYVALRDLGFSFVRLEPSSEYNPTDPIHQHASERDWPSFPYDIYLQWGPIETRVERLLSLTKFLQ